MIAMRHVTSVALLVLGTVGCAHQIAFQRINYHIGSEPRDASLVVVIDDDTLNQTVSVRSFMTGIAHSWDAQPGMMLKQIADIEFPQMFKHYEVVRDYQDPKPDQAGLTLHLAVPQYAFTNFHAMVTVEATAYGPGKTQLFDKTYTQEGSRQGGEDVLAGRIRDEVCDTAVVVRGVQEHLCGSPLGSGRRTPMNPAAGSLISLVI